MISLNNITYNSKVYRVVSVTEEAKKEYVLIPNTEKVGDTFNFKTAQNFTQKSLGTRRVIINGGLWWSPVGYSGNIPWGLLKANWAQYSDLWAGFSENETLVFSLSGRRYASALMSPQAYQDTYSEYDNGLTVYFSIIKNGVKNISGISTSNYIYSGSHERTIIAWKGTTFYLITTDSITGDAAASFCLEQGYTAAYSLDGGSSTSLWVDGSIKQGCTRQIISTIEVYERDIPDPPAPEPVAEPTGFVNVGGIKKTISDIKVNVGGVAKDVNGLVINVNGSPKVAWRRTSAETDFPARYGAAKWNKDSKSYIGGCTAIKASKFKEAHIGHNGGVPDMAFNGTIYWSNSWKTESGNTNWIWFEINGLFKPSGIEIWGPGMSHEQSGYQATSLAIDVADVEGNYTQVFSTSIPITVSWPQSWNFTPPAKAYKYLRLRLGGQVCLVSTVRFRGLYYSPVPGID